MVGGFWWMPGRMPLVGQSASASAAVCPVWYAVWKGSGYASPSESHSRSLSIQRWHESAHKKPTVTFSSFVSTCGQALPT